MEWNQSPINMVRLMTIIMGAIATGLGYYSHLTSGWMSYNGRKLYEVCDVMDTIPENFQTACPSIALEYYFLSAIAACLGISLLVLILSCFIDLSKSPVKFIDGGYHTIAALALFSAGVISILSTAQILRLNLDQLYSRLRTHPLDENSTVILARDYKLHGGVKHAAAAVSILESFLYGYGAMLIALQ